MTQEEKEILPLLNKRDDLYKSWGYDIEKLPYGSHMWLEPEKNTRQNPYSGVIVELNPVELSIYDTLMTAYHDHIELGIRSQNASIQDLSLAQARTAYEIFRAGKDWFIENNIEAYMDLID